MADNPEPPGGVSTTVSLSTVPGTAVCGTAEASSVTLSVAVACEFTDSLETLSANGDATPASKLAVNVSELGV